MSKKYAKYIWIAMGAAIVVMMAFIIVRSVRSAAQENEIEANNATSTTSAYGTSNNTVQEDVNDNAEESSSTGSYVSEMEPVDEDEPMSETCARWRARGEELGTGPEHYICNGEILYDLTAPDAQLRILPEVMSTVWIGWRVGYNALQEMTDIDDPDFFMERFFNPIASRTALNNALNFHPTTIALMTKPVIDYDNQTIEFIYCASDSSPLPMCWYLYRIKTNMQGDPYAIIDDVSFEEYFVMPEDEKYYFTYYDYLRMDPANEAENIKNTFTGCQVMYVLRDENGETLTPKYYRSDDIVTIEGMTEEEWQEAYEMQCDEFLALWDKYGKTS